MTDYIRYRRGESFGRFKALRAAIVAAHRILDIATRQRVLAAIPAYRSRGKGWKRGGFFRNCLSRTQNPRPSKYRPHIGKKQIARGLCRG